VPNFVAKANPDGHTLLLMEPAAVLAKWMNKTVPYDVINDFKPIALVATQPLMLFGQPSLPVSDVKELIAYSKANQRAGNLVRFGEADALSGSQFQVHLTKADWCWEFEVPERQPRRIELFIQMIGPRCMRASRGP
jgi:tripartite-type tricarboxylate transporter receptor subunit TctC